MAAPRPEEGHHIFASCRFFAVSESKPLPQKVVGEKHNTALNTAADQNIACYCLTHKALYSHVLLEPAFTLNMVLPTVSSCSRAA